MEDDRLRRSLVADKIGQVRELLEQFEEARGGTFSLTLRARLEKQIEELRVELADLEREMNTLPVGNRP